MKTGSPIPIVFTIDTSYSAQCAATICSVAANTNHKIKIYILHNGLRMVDFLRLKYFLIKSKISSTFIKIDLEMFKESPVFGHVSEATYFRIAIPELIPENIKKVVFLDSDLIVKEDIKELYSIDITGYSHAAVQNFLMPLEDLKKLGIDDDQNYFNAGVMVINLEYWREQQVTLNTLKYISSNRDAINFWDQDALNAVLKSKWKIIDPAWNVQSYFFDQSAGLSKSAQESINAPKIIHYSGGGACKPWAQNCTHALSYEYYHYLNKTPWKSNYNIKKQSV